MFESGIRGGIATISHRHAKANSEYMGAEFYPTNESKFISYLDANNLYGWAMSKQLPTSGFKWMTENGWLKTSYLYPWSWLRVSERYTRPSQWLSSCSETR